MQYLNCGQQGMTNNSSFHFHNKHKYIHDTCDYNYNNMLQYFNDHDVRQYHIYENKMQDPT